MKTYIVQPGDTLYGISKQFGVSLDILKSTNNLQSNALSVGQVLKIPSNQITYTVKKGDSLYSIARSFGTTVDQLKANNNLKSNILTIGQTLIISKQTSFEVPDNYILYTVKKGDTLFSIATANGISIDTLKKANNLSTNTLSVGQKIYIPNTTNNELFFPEGNDVSKTQDISYVVKKGDTLFSIANQFNTTVELLKKLNNLTSNSLYVGQTLTVLDNVTDNFGKSCYGTSYVEPAYETYTVKKGDSLYVIAKRYNTTVDNLKKLNNLTSNTLSIGQVLKVRRTN